MISPSKRASWVTGSGFAVGASSSPLSSATTSTGMTFRLIHLGWLDAVNHIV